MNSYSKGNLPRIDNKPAGKKYYHESASSYRAVDASSVYSDVKIELESLKAEIEKTITDIKTKVDQMAKSYGEDFITLNGVALGFVDIESFDALLKSLQEQIDTSTSNTNSFFDSVIRETDNINNWLNELEANLENYNQLEGLISKNEKSKNEQDQAKVSEWRNKISEYEKLPNEPITYGDWIRG